MTPLDWGVVCLYLLLLIGLGLYLNQYQEDTYDYFLAGQSMTWWQTGFSTMATQLSAVSFISVPAFVALKENGGMRWLAFEFAVPLALIVVMAVIIPVFHREKYISMNQYLGDRFDSGTRSLISGLFLLMRGLSSGAIIYGGAKIIAPAINIRLFWAILIIGVVTILYDVLGGIGVVIYSDVIQMAIIFLGLIYCGITAIDMVGWQTALNTFDPARKQILFMNDFGTTEGSSYGFWPFLIGGFVLYVAYYGCDQSQVQREMSVEDVDAVRKSMLLNAFGRFPIVLIYCTVGILVGAVFTVELSSIAGNLGMKPAELSARLNQDYDFMLPYFMVGALPKGITGLLIVATLAALMSSLDSAMNSLSAITVRDFYQEHWVRDASKGHYLLAGRFFTFLWGGLATVSALTFHYWSQVETVVVLINQIGNAFYGPLAAIFLLGMLTRWSTPNGVKTGVMTGLTVNLIVWQFFPSISWLWWGPIGFSVTVIAAFGTLLVDPAGPPLPYGKDLLDLGEVRHQVKWIPWYGYCVIYFLVIVGVCYGIEITL